jgi:ParB family chromosome partitioning protein
MEILTSLVDLENISPRMPRSAFSEEELEKVARLIAEAETLVKPVILKRTGIETCEIVDGDFEYYATVKAVENGLSPAEIVAFIIPPKLENSIKEQGELLSKYSSSLNPASDSNSLKTLPVSEETEETVSLTEIVDRLLDRRLNPITLQLEKLTSSFSDFPRKTDENTVIRQQLNALNDKLDNLTVKSDRPAEKTITQGLDDIPKRLLEAVVLQSDNCETEAEKLQKQEQFITHIKTVLDNKLVEIELEAKKLKGNYQEMKVPQLKALIKERNIPTKSISKLRKNDLIKILEEADNS